MNINFMVANLILLSFIARLRKNSEKGDLVPFALSTSKNVVLRMSIQENRATFQ